jgi:hypothetical protein
MPGINVRRLTMSDSKGNQKSDPKDKGKDKQKDDQGKDRVVDKHYTRQSDGFRQVIIGDDKKENHGHIVYDKEGDVVYIRGEDTPRDRAEYDTNKGHNVDDPNWPNTNK